MAQVYPGKRKQSRAWLKQFAQTGSDPQMFNIEHC